VFTPDDFVNVLLPPPVTRPELVPVVAPLTLPELGLPLPPLTTAELLALVPPSPSGSPARLAPQPAAKAVTRPALAHKPAVLQALLMCVVHCQRLSAPVPNILIRALWAPLFAAMIPGVDEA
jgi:hypothetical protein